MIRVLLAEDQATVREALEILLGLQPDIVIVAAVARGDEVVAAAATTQPDVALLDIQMPGMDGLEAAAALRERLPACKVLILTTFGQPGYLRRAMRQRGRRLPDQGSAGRPVGGVHPPRCRRGARRRSRAGRDRARLAWIIHDGRGGSEGPPGSAVSRCAASRPRSPGAHLRVAIVPPWRSARWKPALPGSSPRE